MAAPLKLPRLPANWQTQPVFFTRAWNDAMTQIETLVNQIIQIPEVQQALDKVNMTAQQAQIAADTASKAATQAQQATQQANQATALTNSYVTPANIFYTYVNQVKISDNVRHYGDGTSVNVTGGQILNLTSNTRYYVYYDDPNRAGGNVCYQVTTDPSVAAQIGARHTLGSFLTVANSDTSSATVAPPGVSSIRNNNNPNTAQP